MHLCGRSGSPCAPHHAGQKLSDFLFIPEIDENELEEWFQIKVAWVLHPDCNFRRYWDLFMMVLILYSCITVPYRIAFGVEAKGFDAIFDRFMDVMFMSDICLCFRTAIIPQDTIIASPAVLAKTYLTGFPFGFFLDFLSSFPFDILIDAEGGSAGTSAEDLAKQEQQIRILKMIRILRMFKILRMVRIKKLLKKIQDDLSIKNGVMISVKFSLFTVFAAHFQACLWFGIADPTNEEGTWAVNYCIMEGSSECGDLLESVGAQYIASFYWSLVTMTTLGYGDITPGNNTERLFCVFAMLVGASIFAYAITNMCTLVHNLDASGVFYRSRMDELNDYMEFLRLPKSMRKKVMDFFFYKINRSNVCHYNEDLILQDMSKSMKEEVRYYVLHSLLDYIPFIKEEEVGKHFMSAIATKLKSEAMAPGDFLCRQGEIATEMYLVSKGAVEVLSNGQSVSTLGEGSCFCASAMFRPTRFGYSVRVAEYSDVFYISKYDFDEVCDLFNIPKEYFEKKAIDKGMAGSERDFSSPLMPGEEEEKKEQLDKAAEQEAERRRQTEIVSLQEQIKVQKKYIQLLTEMSAGMTVSTTE